MHFHRLHLLDSGSPDFLCLRVLAEDTGRSTDRRRIRDDRRDFGNGSSLDAAVPGEVKAVYLSARIEMRSLSQDVVGRLPDSSVVFVELRRRFLTLRSQLWPLLTLISSCPYPDPAYDGIGEARLLLADCLHLESVQGWAAVFDSSRTLS